MTSYRRASLSLIFFFFFCDRFQSLKQDSFYCYYVHLAYACWPNGHITGCIRNLERSFVLNLIFLKFLLTRVNIIS